MNDGKHPIEVVSDFIRCFNENRIDDAVACLSEDVFYHNMPLEPMAGREAVRAFCASVDLGNTIKTEWEVLAIAAHGDVVLTERIDAFYRDDGRRDSLPLMGSFRVRGGEIVEWRDYFDLAAFQAMAVLAPEN